MKCNQCRALIEEHLDGELNQQSAAKVTAHLSACVECASYATEIGQEYEVYAGYSHDVEVTPKIWQSVQARIRDEVRTPESLFDRVVAWLGSKLIAPRFSPALAAALMLITIAATVGVMSYIQSRPGNNQEIAGLDEKLQGEADKDRITKDDGKKDSEDESVVPTVIVTPPNEKPVDKPRPSIKQPSTSRDPDRLIKQAEQNYIAAIRILTRDLKDRRPQLDPETRARLDNALAEIDQTIYATRQAVRRNPGDPIAFGYLLTAYSKKVDFLREVAAEN